MWLAIQIAEYALVLLIFSSLPIPEDLPAPVGWGILLVVLVVLTWANYWIRRRLIPR